MNLKVGAYVIAIIAAFGFVNTLRMFKRDRLTARLLLMWLAVWFSIGFFALFPSLLDRLMRLAQMGDRPFFLTTGAIVLLYILMFYISSAVSRMNAKIGKLAQQIAIMKHCEGKSGNKKSDTTKAE